MLTPIPQEIPKTWPEHSSTDETSETLDAIHPEVVDLFKMLNADKLDKNARANLMNSITKIATTTIIIKSPVNDEIMLLHQISKVGGDILNKL